MPLFPLLWLFFCYSFLGWVLETAVSAVRLHRYVDRSVLFGPLCACYGITAVLLTEVCPSCGATTSSSSWAAPSAPRWWNGSPVTCWRRPPTPAGGTTPTGAATWTATSVSAPSSCGACWAWRPYSGSIPLLLALYRWLPPLVGEILLWVLLALLAADIAGTVLTLCGVRSSRPRWRT